MDNLTEIEVLPLEKVIDNELVKQNITDTVIAELKERYGGLKLESIEDKENYLVIKEAKKEVRKWGIMTEKVCKKGREDAVKAQKLWLSKEKETLQKIAEVEDPLQAEIDRFDAHVAQVETERIKRQEEAYIHRQATLAKMGAKYEAGCFELNDVSFELDIIKNADDDIWENSILPKYTIQYEKNEVERVRQEKERREQDEKMRLEREQLEKAQAELKQAQEELQKQKEEAEAEKSAANQKLQNKRLTELLPFNPQGSDVSMVTLWTLSESEYLTILEKKKAEFEKAKIEREKVVQDEAAQKERERIAEEQHQAEIKRQEAEEKEQKELEAADDKTKWVTWVNELNAIPNFPSMKSSIYKNKVSIAKEKIEEIINL